MRRMAFLALVLTASAASAEQQQTTPVPPPAEPPRIEERIEVVGVTPIHGTGLPKTKVPANVQAFTADAIRSWLALDVPNMLAVRAASVHVGEAQASTFQPDVLFRGFAGSPLLGASEGLAVYQDGVRINDPFGDTVQWDMLPSAAIANIDVMPGSNPLFGLNALGGALSVRTKDGFGFAGQRLSLTTGSFGRHRVDAESGAHGAAFAYFVAGSLADEAGWRDFSPSALRRLFGDLGWRSGASALNVSVTAASNDLVGNGPAPVELLQRDADAVFTHPDRTDNDIVLVTVRARRQVSDRTLLESVAYFRDGRIRTFNGDAMDDIAGFDAINNISRTHGRGAGATGQLTRTSPLWGRDNYFSVGGGVDAASTQFDFATELAQLTQDRGTTRTGVFDDDAFVDLGSRLVSGSTFVTNVWSITPAIALSGSARWNWTTLRLRDHIGTALNGDHRFQRVNPAAGLTYQVRRWLNIYGSYAQSSRVPTPVELTCADPEDPCRLPNAFVSDPPLHQIVARTWEAGARGTTARSEWSVAAFDTASTDDIIFVSSGALRGEGHFENVARTRRRGIEGGIEYEVANRLTAFGTITLQRAAFDTTFRVVSLFHPEGENGELSVVEGNRLPGVPSYIAKLGLTTLVTDRLNLSVNVRSQSGQFLRGDESNLLSPLPGFAVLDAQARQRIAKRVSVVAEVQNIFDKRFYTFGVLGDARPALGHMTDDPRFYSPGAPRAAWLGVEVRF
jgi:iron complex outermembrane recepter protein